jgi:LysR family transcriptional regulator, cyn operon transcriptional activator
VKNRAYEDCPATPKRRTDFPGTERIRAFVTLAHELHFGRAARLLHLSQSALSQQIAAFERDVGLLLFERNTRSVRLSQAGDHLLRVVRPALHSLSIGLGEALRQADLAARTLTVSHSGWGTGEVIARAARSLAQSASKVVLLPKLTDFGAEVSQLTLGEADLVLLWRPYCLDTLVGLDTMSCAQVPVCLAVPEGHRLANREMISVNDLADEVLLRLPDSANFDLSTLWPGANVNGVSPAISDYVAASALDVYTAVSARVGVALVPRTAELESSSNRVHFVPATDATAELVITWLPGDQEPGRRAAISALRQSGTMTGSLRTQVRARFGKEPVSELVR